MPFLHSVGRHSSAAMRRERPDYPPERASRCRNGTARRQNLPRQPLLASAVQPRDTDPRAGWQRRNLYARAMSVAADSVRARHDSPKNSPFLVKNALPPPLLSRSFSRTFSFVLLSSGAASVQSIPQPTTSPVVNVGPKVSPVPRQQNARPSSPWYPHDRSSQPGKRESETTACEKPMPVCVECDKSETSSRCCQVLHTNVTGAAFVRHRDFEIIDARLRGRRSIRAHSCSISVAVLGGACDGELS